MTSQNCHNGDGSQIATNSQPPAVAMFNRNQKQKLVVKVQPQPQQPQKQQQQARATLQRQQPAYLTYFVPVLASSPRQPRTSPGTNRSTSSPIHHPVLFPVPIIHSQQRHQPYDVTATSSSAGPSANTQQGLWTGRQMLPRHKMELPASTSGQTEPLNLKMGETTVFTQQNLHNDIVVACVTNNLTQAAKDSSCQALDLKSPSKHSTTGTAGGSQPSSTPLSSQQDENTVVMTSPLPLMSPQRPDLTLVSSPAFSTNTSSWDEEEQESSPGSSPTPLDDVLFGDNTQRRNEAKKSVNLREKAFNSSAEQQTSVGGLHERLLEMREPQVVVTSINDWDSDDELPLSRHMDKKFKGEDGKLYTISHATSMKLFRGDDNNKDKSETSSSVPLPSAPSKAESRESANKRSISPKNAPKPSKKSKRNPKEIKMNPDTDPSSNKRTLKSKPKIARQNVPFNVNSSKRAPKKRTSDVVQDSPQKSKKREKCSEPAKTNTRTKLKSERKQQTTKNIPNSVESVAPASNSLPSQKTNHKNPVTTLVSPNTSRPSSGTTQILPQTTQLSPKKPLVSPKKNKLSPSSIQLAPVLNTKRIPKPTRRLQEALVDGEVQPRWASKSPKKTRKSESLQVEMVSPTRRTSKQSDIKKFLIPTKPGDKIVISSNQASSSSAKVRITSPSKRIPEVHFIPESANEVDGQDNISKTSNTVITFNRIPESVTFTFEPSRLAAPLKSRKIPVPSAGARKSRKASVSPKKALKSPNPKKSPELSEKITVTKHSTTKKKINSKKVSPVQESSAKTKKSSSVLSTKLTESLIDESLASIGSSGQMMMRAQRVKSANLSQTKTTKKTSHTKKVKKKVNNNGWTIDGKPYRSFAYDYRYQAETPKTCYPSIIRKDEDSDVICDVIMVGDCVLINAHDDSKPYVAKVTAIWTEDSGQIQLSIIWYYRADHILDTRLRPIPHAEELSFCTGIGKTNFFNRGKEFHCFEDELFCSTHRDQISISCVEDKCHVLSYPHYCRAQSRLERGHATALLANHIEDHLHQSVSKPLSTTKQQRPTLYGETPCHIDHSEVFFFCRSYYDVMKKKVLKNLPLRSELVKRMVNNRR